MAAASGERAPAFTAQELEKLVDGVLPQYTLLYGPPDQQVSAHQKRDIWRAIAKEVQTLGTQRRGTHCRKRWEDIRRCSKKTAEAQLGMASQRGRGARRTMTPLMFRILAVAYPELDGRLRTSQQTQGASTDGGTVAPEHEGAASHMAMEGHTTDSEFTSGTEGEGSFTSATGSPNSDTDSSADGSSPVVAAPSVRPTSTEPLQLPIPVYVRNCPYVKLTFLPPPRPPIHQSRRSASSKKPPVPVVRVPGFWSAPSTRAGSRTRSQGTVSPPPVKAPKLESGRRDRVKTPGGTNSEMGSKAIGESSVTPKKVGKVQRKSPQPVVSVTAEKCAIISGGPDTTASTVVTGPETTARVTAQEGSSIVTGQETTARVIAQEGPSIVTGHETTARVIAQEGPSIFTGQETTATAGVTAQEGSSIVTGQETTARVIAQEGPSIVTGQETTAGVTAQMGLSIVTGQETTARVIAQEGPSIVTGQETTATARVIAQEGPSIVTGQETTATAGVTAQEGSSILTGQETTPES
ncbi:hypothetical protein NDU88_010857 [Pleurodeles waltl]|uniref:Myb/SANT-like DNA-binding domain-containing protein n=1 Tax=Pleurodeles waltl TaxID=8319 RepID=A0AAV7R003_PLEWA|nr:hypothetical protein NDU88_010857 [Pleurodeles waltl]